MIDSQHESKTKFLDAAMHIIRVKGYTATRIEDVCEEACLTKGSFFHHFKSKEELATAAADYWSEVTTGVFASAPYRELSDPLDRVLAYVDFRKAILQGRTLPDFTCLVGTMVQEVYDTNPSIREACNRSISEHAATVEADIAEAMEKYGVEADWTAQSLALYTQATLQGAFILAKAKGGPEIAVSCIDHLHRYIEMLFPQSDSRRVCMTEVPQQGDKTVSEGLEAPRFEDGRPMLLAGLRDEYTMATMREIPALWRRFDPYLGKLPQQISGVTYGVCFPSSEGFGYMAGVEVRSAQGLPEELSVVTMPVERYAVFTHKGHISKLSETCRAIEHEWLPRSRYSFALGAPGAPGFFERYGESFDAKIGVGDVEVWVPIR
jgi:TetR/AcrR family transcriptional regulator, transcriptional repressor for nem operon